MIRQFALLAGMLAAGSSTVAAQTLTLTEAASLALDSHPALSAAGARVDAADQAASVARASRLPAFGITGTLTRFEEPMVVAPLHAFDPTRPPSFDRTLVQAQAGLAYTLFDAGARSARIAGSGSMVVGAEYGLAATEMSVLEHVASAYLGTLSARAVLEAATAHATAVAEEAARAQRHFDVGTAAEVEVLRARAALQDARAQQATAASRVGLAERNLARVMGVTADEVQGRALADIESRDHDLPSAATPSESPIVGQATQLVAAADAALGEQRAGRLPKVEIRAGVLDFGTLDTDHVTEWQAGLQVSWPLFTGGGRSAAIRRAEAEVRAARSELQATELRVEAEIDAAATAVSEAESRAEALSAAVTQWTEVARIEALAVEAGSGVQSDLLRAQAGLFQSRAGHARARYDAIAARVAEARARGTLNMNWLNEVLEIRP